MVGVGRVGDGEFAVRVNAAADLADDGVAAAVAAGVLADRFGVSGRQARRYVDRAAAGRVEIPDATVAFTVKVSARLAGRVRSFAGEHGVAISAVVSAALVEYLARAHRSGRPER